MTDAQFWTREAPAYAARPVGNVPAWDATLARVRAWMPPEAEILEFGCGTGSSAIRLADAAAHITATDYAEGMIAQAKAKPAPANLTFLTAAPGDPTLAGRRFDMVMAFNLLHLIRDLDGTLAQMRDHLAPGGLLVTKSVCLGGRWRVFMPVIGALRLVGKAPYVRFMTRAGLETAIDRAGFEILETGDYPARPPSRLVIARRI
ncbi:class I SAM-dependent methyltransferase [Roseobacter sp. HKCCA0434]|uniref:class I SAM-dependent methyltransferase n=1 Tax=Roseobacter sp. HKCCA0434 TaxID=3079297 RepID=UPI002905A666|nr:class I SAM-dependent methyltransferase [Roseobacter sp. HKCCA0434]